MFYQNPIKSLGGYHGTLILCANQETPTELLD